MHEAHGYKHKSDYRAPKIAEWKKGSAERETIPNTHLLETCLIAKLVPALIFYINVHWAASEAFISEDHIQNVMCRVVQPVAE